MITLQNAVRDGKDRIEIFVPSTKMFCLIPPIDARDLVNKGTGILDWVIIRDEKGEESVVSSGNVSDTDTVIRSARYWDADKKVSNPIMQSRIVVKSVSTPQTEIDFEACTDEVLLQFADMAGLSKTIKKRETIIEKLKELGFDPSKETDQKPE